MFSKSITFSSLMSVAAGSVLFTQDTPLTGRSLVANFDPSNATAISQAKEAFPSIVDSLFEAGALNTTDMTFSIDVFSAATNKSLYSYTHVGQNEEGSLTAGKLDDGTITRIGSVAKLFTVYAIIAKMGIDVLNRPVTDYLPELISTNTTHSVERIRFEDLTVGALASHQGGTGGAAEALAINPEHPEDVTPQELFTHMLSSTKHPVTAPYERAMYSDGGYLLLTQMLERMSGMTYDEAIHDILSKPLGLEGTSAVVPEGDDINAIDRRLIDEASLFGYDVPIAAGSGGIYSSRKDFRTLGLSILNSDLLSPATTRRWMKPMSSTGSLVELVGAPWEIARLAVPVSPNSNRTRVSDLYTKAGGNNDYTAIMALSPDHGIGFSVLVAGPPQWAGPGRFVLRNAIGEAFIPAAEWAAVENAKRNMVGTFVGEDPKAANLTLSFDDEGAGLVIDSAYVNGSDAKWVMAGNLAPAPVPGMLRLYPTGTNSQSVSLASQYKPGFTGSVSHRVVAPQEDARAGVEGGKGMFDNSFAWMGVGFLGTVDELILQFEGGRLIAVESSSLETVLKRAN